VCIDEAGQAKVYGGKAFFLEQTAGKPEKCEKNVPLTWEQEDKAILCSEIQGSNNPAVKFNVKTWTSTDATGYYLYVIDGVVKTANIE
jgi:hypothetical protein